MSSSPHTLGRTLGAALAAATLAAPVARAQDTVLTLGQAARLAARQSAGVEAAQFRTAQATARVRQARSALLPNVSATAGEASRTFNTASFGISFPTAPGQRPLFDPNGSVQGPVSMYDVRGQVAMNLLDLAATQRVRAARTAERASAAEASSQGQLAASTAAVTYLRALRAEAQLSNRVADSTLAAELVRIARDQLQAGTGVALDVTRAQSQLAATRAQLIAARNDRDRARLDLLRALNLPLTTPVRLANPLAGLPLDEPLPDEREAVQRAIAQRPDLRALAEQQAVVDAQARAIRAEALPTVSAYANDGVTGLGLDRRLLPTYNYGLQVNVPIFEGFRREGRVEESRAQAGELAVRRRDLEAQTSVEVSGALLDMASAREQVAAARERQMLAEQEVAQARDRFRAGVAGNADVITASLSLNQARTAYVDALTLYQNARVALARAEGTVTELP